MFALLKCDALRNAGALLAFSVMNNNLQIYNIMDYPNYTNPHCLSFDENITRTNGGKTKLSCATLLGSNLLFPPSVFLLLGSKRFLAYFSWQLLPTRSG